MEDYARDSTREITQACMMVMQAYLDGKEIEFIRKYPSDSEEWHSSINPSWDWVTYDYRIKPLPHFRLPTKEEYEKLISHFSRWNAEKKGLEILNINGDILFLPADGDRIDTLNYRVGSHGDYWSSDVNKSDSGGAYGLYFDSRSTQTNRYSCNYGRSVRLVSDVPFEGGIEIAGLWWKPDNEEGYFTWNEANEKFNII